MATVVRRCVMAPRTVAPGPGQQGMLLPRQEEPAIARNRDDQQRPQAATPTRRGATEARILETALTILGRDGYQALTTRAIAEEGGVNQALINYHFGTKQQLLLAMAEALEAGKYARQGDMYAQPDVPLSQKWRQATAFYREDLADGWIRILHELHTLGATDPAIAARIRAILARWQALLSQVAAEALPPLGIHLPPEYLASVIISFWFGMDARILGGETEADGQFFAILDRIGDWLEERERAVGAVAARPSDGRQDD